MITSLRSQRENLLQSLKRDSAASNRKELLGPKQPGPPQETERTAGLDNAGILQLQNQVIRQQDQELGQIEETMISTKHVALAMGEELNLQERLLGDMEEDVDVVHSRLRAVTNKVKSVMRQSKEWKWWCLVIVLAIVLVVVLVIVFKVK